ncbi:MAG: FAD-dependent monooxygenase [Pseudomonadota bacterium]|nr:FAD-dependent monooxygenase [Pseudomonadota bacterium]
MSSQKIMIAGAGLGGLAAAGCLLKAGFDVEIFEQAPQLGEVGAGIQLSANAMHVMNHLGIGDEISALSVRPAEYVFRLHDSGEIIDRFELSEEHLKLHKAPYNQVHRADLHATLARAVLKLNKDVVHLNKKAIGYTETSREVELHFEDGSSSRGDLLIGADGVKSVIRDQVAGAVKTIYTGDSAWRLTVPKQKLPPNFMEEVMSVWMGPGKHSVSYWIRGGDLLNFVGAVETPIAREESWTAKFPWEDLKADFEGWHEDIQTIINLVDKDECYRWALYRRPTIENWSSKRVTILGDAAHATLPYLAQGAAMAVEDGAILSRALEQNRDIADALQLYQRNRTERTARVVNTSDANRKRFHLDSVEKIRKSFTNRDEGADRNGWLYSYNPLTVELK